MDWIITIVTSLGGAAMGGAITYLTVLRQSKTTDLNLLITTLRDDNNNLREREEENRNRIIEVERELNELRQTVLLLESAHQDLPIPMWLKDTKGTMLSINQAYEDVFLTPRGMSKEDYIGHTDENVWPEDYAITFKKNDQKVLRSGRIFHGKEKVLYDGQELDMRIIKYPRYAGRIKIGIAGIGIPPENIELD